jgi:23S rRNA pseudouridine2605 synthase
LNQQQLQTARAALWHQNAAPLETLDDAAAWLDAIGLCLFLPRHAQLPAPAPSFAEAVLGAPGAAPAPPVIAQATGFANRLMASGRAIPLNLLGTFSEQPDFLVTLDVLPWVVAVRGDRQWKTAPGARSAPIVVRTWEALAQHGPQTAVEIRELLGRELTEAAVLRALVELWTALRAAPSYADGEPTRWSLLKDRHAAQLATAASTALPTALSALLSIYLRSAVAATAEEAEIFLSPLTARSRIREVVHGMTAARQFGTTTVGTHTLLFVEGSLPEGEPEAETAPAAEPGSEAVAPAPPHFAPRPPRREFAGKRPPFRKDSEPRPFQPRRPWQKDRPAAGFRNRRDDRPAAGFRPRREEGAADPGREERAGSAFKPRFPRREGAAQPPRREFAGKRPPFRKDSEPRPFQPKRPWQKDRPAREGRGEFPPKSGDRPRSDHPPRFDRGGKPGFAAPRRKPFSDKPGFGGKPKFAGAADRGPRRERPSRPNFAGRPARSPRPDSSRAEGRPGLSPSQPRENRSAPPRPFNTGKSGSRPPQKFRGDRPAPRFGKGPGKSAFGSGPRTGKPGFGKGPGKPRFGQAKPRFGKGKAGFSSDRPGKPARLGDVRPPRTNFRKSSSPSARKPRKNRSKDETSE